MRTATPIKALSGTLTKFSPSPINSTPSALDAFRFKCPPKRLKDRVLRFRSTCFKNFESSHCRSLIGRQSLVGASRVRHGIELGIIMSRGPAATFQNSFEINSN
jgi:hypothetical protein